MEVIDTQQEEYRLFKPAFKVKQMQELNEIYNRLKKEATEFINKLTKDRTKMEINKIDDKIYVSVYNYNEDEFKREYGERKGINCLTPSNGYFDEVPYIKITYICNLLEKDLNLYDVYIRNINENYDEDKKTIEGKKIRANAFMLKQWMLDTHDKLNDILQKYEWTFY